MDRFFVSSSICSLPATPEALLSDWESHCRGDAVAGLCLDPRLDHELQREVLALCRRRGVVCLEIGHPATGAGRRPAASAISADRDERLTALQQLLETARRAHDFGVQQVTVPPWLLALSPSPAHLAERFQRDLDLGLPELDEARSVAAGQALDACCLVLDPALRALEDLNVELVLLHPTAWPHQFPDVDELARLERIFQGSPLAACLAVDWGHIGRHLDRSGADLRGLEGTDGETVCRRIARVADACGLAGMLPVGTGEVDWHSVAPALTGVDSAVLAYDAALSTTPRELAAGLELLRRLPPTPG